MLMLTLTASGLAKSDKTRHPSLTCWQLGISCTFSSRDRALIYPQITNWLNWVFFQLPTWAQNYQPILIYFKKYNHPSKPEFKIKSYWTWRNDVMLNGAEVFSNDTLLYIKRFSAIRQSQVPFDKLSEHLIAIEEAVFTWKFYQCEVLHKITLR